MSEHRSPSKLTSYTVWDRTTRWFHWINLLCIIGLAGIGTVILVANTLGVSAEARSP